MSPRRRKGTPPPAQVESLYPTLDLHGHTADEAERTADRWLTEQQRAGEGVVRVITGRGRRSVGPPVLPVVIDELLLRLKGSVILRYELEAGGGAFRIELLRPRATLQPRRGLQDAPVDPELALEAHQSLADLGIEPTPTLVRLEVERIVKNRRGEAD